MTTTTFAPEGRLFAGVELRDVETTESFSMIKGRAVPYGEFTSIGWFMEQFAPRSLGKSTREAARDLPLNIFHENRLFPIGAADRWTESDEGLDGIWRLDEDSEMAQNAARLADRGMLTGLSIEFIPIRYAWDRVDPDDWDPSLGPDHMNKLTHTEARLLAVGLVQSPAYVSAGVDSVRSAGASLNLVHSAIDDRPTSGGQRRTPVLDEMKRLTEALRR